MTNNVIEQLQKDITKIATDYAGNEAALQKAYAANPQVRELLALQELKSMQDAAIRQRKMEAQVPRAKVIDQLKQEIVGGMPQEGILAAAQGGMVRGFAEGGEVDLNGAVQTLPSDASDAPTETDPDQMEEILDSSYEEEIVENPSTGEQIMKIGGALVDWATDNPVDALSLGLMFVPGLGWGALAGLRGVGFAYRALKGVDYVKKGRQIGQGIVKGSQGLGQGIVKGSQGLGRVAQEGSKGLGRVVQKGFTVPKTRIPKGQAGAGQFVKGGSRAFSLGRTAAFGGPLTGGALLQISDLYENGFSDEDIEEAIASGQLTQELGTGTDTGTDTGTGTTDTGTTDTVTGTGATTEPPMSAYDQIMAKYGATYKDEIDNLDKEGRIKRKEDRLARLAEISKPEERSFLDMASDFFAGAAASGIGGGGEALRQAELAGNEKEKNYQKMLIENEEQIDTLEQELGDKEMAIKLTAGTNEYARDMAAKALAIDNARDQRDFALEMLKTMEESITDNWLVMQKTEQGDVEGAKEIAKNLREILRETPGYKTLTELANKAEALSSGLNPNTIKYIPNQT